MKILKPKEYIKCGEEEKIRIAIIYQIASYWPSIESFYNACLKDKEVDIKVFFVDETAVESAPVLGSDKFLKSIGVTYSIYSEKAIRDFMPHVALMQSPYDVSLRNPEALSIRLKKMGIRIIYIPYGIEIADTEEANLDHFHTFVIRNAWRIYTFSEEMKKDYFKYCPNRHAVRALGVPKFDCFKNRELFFDDAIMKAAAGRKIVLWKMHFPKIIYEGMKRKQVTPYLSEYIAFAKKINQYKEFFFVVMPHPMFFSHTIPKELAEEAKILLDILADQNNVKIELDADYRKALYTAEAIIIDRSAIMVEAGACGVPILYMKNKDYDEPLTAAVKPLVDTYMNGDCCEDMENFLYDFKENTLECLVKDIKVAQERLIPFLDGNCGRNILEDIKTGIKEYEDKPVQMVLFGAGNVCEHYIHQLKLNEREGINIIGIADNSSEKWGNMCGGMEIFNPEKLTEVYFDALIITTERYYMPIKKKLVYELFIDEDKIWRLDEFSEELLRSF